MLIILALAIFIPGMVLAGVKVAEQRNKKKPHSTVHIQGRTEEAETMDFAVVLFEDESAENKRLRLLEVFEMIEERRKYNNDRMQQAFIEHQEKLKALKKEA